MPAIPSESSRLTEYEWDAAMREVDRLSRAQDAIDRRPD
jgi:hypothetical protein